jgi:hypothetical protein
MSDTITRDICCVGELSQFMGTVMSADFRLAKSTELLKMVC